MPRAQPSPLPPELIHCIMNHLGDSKPALKNCALVSRAFVPYARETLFFELELSFDRVESFLSLCDNLNSTFPPALTRVKEFTFQYRFRFIKSGAFNQLLTWRRKGKDETMVDMLANVRVLTIDRVGWPMLEDPARHALLAGFQNVVEIRLCHLWFKHAEEFSSLISSFPRLKDIQLECLQLNPYVEHLPMQESASDHDKLPLARTTPSLCSIVEVEASPAELIDVLVPLSHSLCTLNCTLVLYEPSRMASIDRLLVSAGPALENVSLDIHPPYGDEESGIAALCTQTFFAANTRIRVLNFPGPNMRKHCQYLLPFLKSIANARSRSDSCSPSPSLEILDINDLAYFSINLSWDELDELLASHWYFSSLKEIKCTMRKYLHVDRQTDEGSAAARMAKDADEFIARMPRCVMKELLKVKVEA